MTSKRRVYDAYYTQQKAVYALLPYLECVPDDIIYEPCCGELAIAKILYRSGLKNVITNDINKKLKAHKHLDAKLFIQLGGTGLPSPDWVITNPPFNKAFEILSSSYWKVSRGVALLLRRSFLEPTFERQDFLVAHPPTKQLTLPRMSFTDDGKMDSVTCDWYIWQKYESPQVIRVIPKFTT